MTPEPEDKWGIIYMLMSPVFLLYFGKSTQTFKKRMKQHKYQAKTGNGHLQRAIQKYGWENFTKVIVVDCVLCKYIGTTPEGRKIYDESELNTLEKHFIRLYQTNIYGYNLTEGGDGCAGLVHSEASRKKMSEAHKGRVPSEATKIKISKARKKHGDQPGSVTYCKKHKKWKVTSARPENKHIGYYLTKEKALKALNLYNAKGEILDSDRKHGGIQKLPSGRYRARIGKKRKYHSKVFSTTQECEDWLKKMKLLL